MNLKLGQLTDIVEALGNLLNQRLPIKAAYWLGKFQRKAKEEVVGFQTRRLRLLEQYCLKDEAGKPVRVRKDKSGAEVPAESGYQGPCRFVFEGAPQEDIAAFNKELQELLDTDVSFDNIRPLTLGMFGDDAKITPQEMAALMALMEEEEAGGAQ